MTIMKMNALFTFMLVLNGCTESTINGQTIPEGKGIGGQCEGCEAIYENATPANKLNWKLRLPDYNKQSPWLHITGTVYKADGKSPAAGTILYFYHTDRTGIYPKKGDEKGWGKRHGYIRGWLKTNNRGQYSLETFRPGAYPNRGIAAHIHCIVKEDNLNEYYIGDILFVDDPLLTNEEKTSLDVPGGSGLIKLQKRNGVLYGERDIYLGRNVRNYPASVVQHSEFILSHLIMAFN